MVFDPNQIINYLMGRSYKSSLSLHVYVPNVVNEISHAIHFQWKMVLCKDNNKVE